VLLVVLTGLATTLVLGSVVAYSWYGEIQRRVETIHPAVLELSAVSLGDRLGRAREAIAVCA
jgi:hypothetical protein